MEGSSVRNSSSRSINFCDDFFLKIMAAASDARVERSFGWNLELGTRNFVVIGIWNLEFGILLLPLIVLR